ncbi:unnamed protein product [Lactuca virosa]|uniref:Serine/threonine-protein phosphatase 4 regulatory subunit 3-like central domain-containing protein n=1 Tax=Lactuca virosa TaxID=75947 RepID=A0AAU9MG61_9ASTR|nr:unnamed protein product [Lactuca virosa]
MDSEKGNNSNPSPVMTKSVKGVENSSPLEIKATIPKLITIGDCSTVSYASTTFFDPQFNLKQGVFAPITHFIINSTGVQFHRFTQDQSYGDRYQTYKDETYPGANGEWRDLPEIELSTLPSIITVVVDSSITNQLYVIELILDDQQYFRKLRDLFRVCEDLEIYDDLHIIYKTVKQIILSSP